MASLTACLILVKGIAMSAHGELNSHGYKPTCINRVNRVNVGSQSSIMWIIWVSFSIRSLILFQDYIYVDYFTD